MAKLSEQQIKFYDEKGYIAPIDVLSNHEANQIRQEIETIEKKWPNALEGIGRNYVHLISPVFNKVCLNNKILDAVESIIGKNILICGTTLFIKNANEKGFVSFHQDAKYIGLEPHNWVTAWIAVTDSNEENGCMRMWSGSHKKNFFEHEDTFDKNNLLTRGQTINSVPKEKTEPILLKAGQMSIHHPMTVHGSGPNMSNERRIGFAIQSYIGTNVKQYEGKTIVQLARGEDKFNFYKHASRVKNFMNKESLRLRDLANEELKKILYKDSQKTRNY